MKEPELILRNRFNNETFLFTEKETDSKRFRFAVVLGEGGSGGGNALVHVHPGASETFTVKAGRLLIVMRGVEQVAEVGESVTIPAGTPHYFANAAVGETEATVEFAPAEQHGRFFRNFAMLTESRPEWFSSKGDPNLLLIALVLHAYSGHLYLAGIPVIAQKVLFALLAQLARLRGYRLALEPLGPNRN
jgi:mannose-6-phosphate isomerase-like protein (cupin superfamily)